MKKIGFVDFFIDEAHANRYPGLIREGIFKGAFDVHLAWAEITKKGGKTLETWCAEQKVGRASSIEQVIEECDCIVVLSPDNPEKHEDLADLPLKSGKPVYIDKPIAPTLKAAERIFEKARKHGTPMMSSSALRFSSEFKNAREKIGDKSVRFVATRGPGSFGVYAIHQLEMLVPVLGTGAKKVLQCGNEASKVMAIDYGDGRRGVVNLTAGQPFQMTVQFGDKEGLVANDLNDYFPRFVEAMLSFFDSGKSAVPDCQTLEIAALIEAGNEALTKPDTWINVPSR